MAYKLVIFGGTTEGRILHGFAHERGIPSLTCVATEYGAEMLSGGCVRVGRLNADEMAEVIASEKPALVVDATHPYASEVSRNVKDAGLRTGVSCLRVSRESSASGGFENLGEIIERLRLTEGGVFVTLGAKEARALTALPGYSERLWLRILPSAEGLAECLALGYQAKQIICMHGPFSKELNLAMFRDTGAKILITKESGNTGGFGEKLAAADELGMEVLILRRPRDPVGVSIDRAKEMIAAL